MIIQTGVNVMNKCLFITSHLHESDFEIKSLVKVVNKFKLIFVQNLTDFMERGIFR